jgi:hypothetical protein
LLSRPPEHELTQWVREQRTKATICLAAAPLFFAALPGLVVLKHFEPWGLWGLKLLVMGAGLLFWSEGNSARRMSGVSRKIVELSERANAGASDIELFLLAQGLLSRVRADWPKGRVMTASNPHIRLLEHCAFQRPEAQDPVLRTIQFLTGQTTPREIGVGFLILPACLLVTVFGLPWLYTLRFEKARGDEYVESSIRKWEAKKACIELNLARLERAVADPGVASPFESFRASVGRSVCAELVHGKHPLQGHQPLLGHGFDFAENEISRRLQPIWSESWVAATTSRMDSIPGLRSFRAWHAGDEEGHERWLPVLLRVREAASTGKLRLLGDDELPPPAERVMFGVLQDTPSSAIRLQSAPWQRYPEGPDSSFTFVLLSNVVSRKSNFVCVFKGASYQIEYTDLEVVIGTWNPFRLLGRRLLSPPPVEDVKAGQECRGGFRIAPDPESYVSLVERLLQARPQRTDRVPGSPSPREGSSSASASSGSQPSPGRARSGRSSDQRH